MSQTSTNETIEEGPGTGRGLPTTTFAILGLLTFGEMSGYDLTKLAGRSVGFFWSPAKSQIYGELRRLVDLGFATEREIEQRDRPDKRVYRITERGVEELQSWLERPDEEPESFKSPFLVKVFFGHLMDRGMFVRRMREYRAQAEAHLGTLRELDRQIRDDPEAAFPYFVLRAGLQHARATIRWIDEVLREVAREGAT
ncbi:MAG TPA: PadR family transcriptional regulator [Actinomycetota bacterium]|nr:PadR family transcriptional regulator [Actinomycetota bacterium]